MALTKVTQDMVDFAVGGGGMPKTEIFTSSGVWLVPQEVQDKITNDGYATVGLFMVGGGGSSDPGEVVNKTIKLTASNYDPQSDWASSTQPEITINVGSTGGITSFTKDPSSGTVGSENPIIATVGRNQTQYFGLTNTYETDSNGYPLVSQLVLGIRVLSGDTPAGYNNTSTLSGLTTLPTINTVTSGDYNVCTLSFPTPTAWDGILQGVNFYYGNNVPSVRLNIGWDLTSKRFSVNNSTSYSSLNAYATFDGTGSEETTISYRFGDVGVTTARQGGSPESAQFLNNISSTEGYFGGFARNGGSAPNSGQPGQAGYVQIYF